MSEVRHALNWVEQVYPADRNGIALVEMTWREWNTLRRALGLKEQEPRPKKGAGGIGKSPSGPAERKRG